MHWLPLPLLSLSHTHTASRVPASICSGNTPFSPRETQETLKPRENAISPRCSRITPPSPGATLSGELLFPRFSSRISSCTLTRSFVFYFGVIHIDFSLQTLDVTFLVFFIFFFYFKLETTRNSKYRKIDPISYKIVRLNCQRLFPGLSVRNRYIKIHSLKIYVSHNHSYDDSNSKCTVNEIRIWGKLIKSNQMRSLSISQRIPRQVVFDESIFTTFDWKRQRRWVIQGIRICRCLFASLSKSADSQSLWNSKRWKLDRILCDR